MNKTRIIKETIGNVLTKLDFKYAGKDQKIVWIFERIIEGGKEQVFIQQHTVFDEEYKIILHSSARGNGIKEIGTIDDTYKDKEYWKAETEKEFTELMKFFADFIEEKCLDILEDMLSEKPDPFETPERKKWFKEHREDLIKDYDSKYHILGEGTNYEQIKRIDQVLRNNREADATPEDKERVYHFILGMSAILSEIIMKSGGIRIKYDSYNVEIDIPSQYSKEYIRQIALIYLVVAAWTRYHNGKCLNRDFLFDCVQEYFDESNMT